MDFSDIRKKSGIVEEDIAKRLQDGAAWEACAAQSPLQDLLRTMASMRQLCLGRCLTR